MPEYYEEMYLFPHTCKHSDFLSHLKILYDKLEVVSAVLISDYDDIFNINGQDHHMDQVRFYTEKEMYKRLKEKYEK